MGKNILIASGKGGTGKTTATAAIASCLAIHGHRTLCIDCDVGLRNLDLALGMTDISATDFSDVTAGRLPLEEAATACPGIGGLWFLAAPSSANAEDVAQADMKKLLAEARSAFDYCLLDAPAGIGAGFRLAAADADMAIIVVNGDASSLRDGQKTVMEASRLGIPEIRLLVNRLTPSLFRRTGATVDDVIDVVGARLIGVVSEDRDVAAALNTEKPLVLFGAKYAYPQFDNIARRIAGEHIPLGKVPVNV